MPHGHAPTVFVSSTCYDLRQLRQDLLKFIESLGYTALISENPAFPVNPQANTVDNCIQAVRDRADIFVMIIGERYGHVTPSGRSVTNLEYLEARAKGIPIYIFVTEPIIHLLPVWKKNPTADFSGTVDTPQLFEFVDEVRTLSGNWVYQFKHAEDITDTLKIQWAILFTGGLHALERLHSPDLSIELRNLNGASLRILLENEIGWEFRLLGSVLREQLHSLNTLRRDIRFSLTIAPVQKFENTADAFHWLNAKIKNAMRYIQSSSQLLNAAAKEAIGQGHTPSDPELVVYIARRLAKIVEIMLEWKQEFSDVATDPALTRILEMTRNVCDEAAETIAAIPNTIDSELEKYFAARTEGKNYILNLHWKLSSPITDEFEQELQRIADLVARQF